MKRASTVTICAASFALGLLLASLNRPAVSQMRDAKDEVIGRYQAVSSGASDIPDIIVLDTVTGRCRLRSTASNDDEGWKDWGSPFEAKR